MQTSDFDFHLPPELVATHPTAERDGSSLMVISRGPATTRPDFATTPEPPPTLARFRDLGEFLPPRSLLVVNETRVMPARLIGSKPTGGKVEVLLLSPASDNAEPTGAFGSSTAREPGSERGEAQLWDALARGLGRFAGGEIRIGRDLKVQIVSRGERGAVRVRLVAPAGRRVADLIEEAGEIPLPPYIVAAREASREGRTASSDDRERYQTVYAATPGAVAAPTAGLHFTHPLMERLRAAGHEFAPLTLHVGAGTFRPVRGEDLAAHRMDVERYSIPPATADAVEEARRTGRPIVAVGTTVVRTLEAAARDGDGRIRAGAGATALFLRPGAEFHVVTDLITNFHLPRSTLLMLVAAFAGRERVLAAYEHAIRARLRFYSYGDAMFIRGTA
ncbi:MAG TPA: tRNA preQ1(34) S-adenosylmethionine ribosyltransferase-isomerase QueA [Polyangia bacterium]